MRYFQIAYLCFALFSSVLSSCSIGTIACEKSGTASLPKICDFFSSYVLSSDKTKCELKRISNCEIPALPNSSAVCYKCNPDYVLDSQTETCVKVGNSNLVNNCEYYKSSPSLQCSLCMVDFYLEGGQCKAVPEEKIKDCLVYMSATSCSLCKSGTFYKDGKCQVISSIKNCHYHREIECEQCADGYYHDPGANKKHSNANFIIQNFDFSSYLTENLHYASWHSDFVIQTCTNSRFDNCKVQTVYDKCDECMDKFYVDSLGRCTRNQYPEIKNCETYQSNLLCQECELKFYLDQNVCTKVTDVASCEEYSKTSNKCEKCNSTHILNNDGSKCNLKTSKSARVETCPDDQCNTCPSGFVPSSNNTFCLEEIQKCSEHFPHDGTSTILTCKTCESGFSPNSEKTFCVPSDNSTCFEYSFNLNTCMACEAGYYISSGDGNTNVCVSRAESGGEGCVSNEATENNESCDRCQEGYHLVTRQVALKDDAFFDTCGKIDQQTGECIQCAENVIGNGTSCNSSNTSSLAQSSPNSSVCLQMKEMYFGSEMDENCGKCINNQTHYLENNQCKPRNASEKLNCLEFYDDRDSCQTCKEGFFPKPTEVETENYPTCQPKTSSFNEINNCLIYDSDYNCKKCVNRLSNSLFLPDPTCEYEDHPIEFFLNSDLQKTQPTHNYTIPNCQKYHQIGIGRLECIQCEKYYVGILPDMTTRTEPEFYLDPESLSLKMWFESCQHQSKAFKDKSKSNSFNDGQCESGMRVFGWQGFLCIGCAPGYYPVGGELVYDGEKNAKNALKGVVSCMPDSSLKRKYKGLGWDLKDQMKKIPLGNLINFDSCQFDDQYVSMSIRTLNNGSLEVFSNNTSLFEPEGLTSCVPLSQMKTKIVDNCLIYLNAKDTSSPNGCLVCKPGYQAHFPANSDVASSCQAITSCDNSKDSKLLHMCEKPLFGWESTSNLADVKVKSTQGNVANCLVYRMNSNQCSLCSKGYSLIAGQCVDVTSQPEYNCSESGFGVSDLTLPLSGGNEALINTHLFFEHFLSFREKPVNFCSECKEGYFLENNNFALSCVDENTIPPSEKISNCKIYKKSKPVFCAQCDTGYLLNSSTGKCVSQSGFSNCLELKGSINAECSKCEDGYLYENNQCTLSNCQHLFNGECSLCKDGFIYESASRKICKANSLANDDCLAYSPTMGTCGKCKDNKLLYIFSDKNSGDVSGFSCETDVTVSTAGFMDGLNLDDGYHVDVRKDEQSVADTLYFVNIHHLDTDDSLKKKYLLNNQADAPPLTLCLPDRTASNCKVPYLQNGVFCTKCEDNKELSSSNICVTPGGDCNETSTCQSCTNQYLHNGRCYPYTPDPNCDQFDPNADKCQTCKDGFELDNNKCVSEGRDPNCKTFNSDNVCVACNDGFLLDSNTNTCVERTAQNCKEVEPTVDKCKVCLDNHYMDSSDEDKCKLYSTVSNCDIYNPTQDKCDKCKNDTYLNGLLCSSVNEPITNCKYYSGIDTCSDCKASFFLIDNKCPEGNVPNCENYIDRDNCSKCEEGYFLKSSTECPAYSPGLNCLEFSSTKDECTSCNSDHKLDSDKKCVPKDGNCVEYEQNGSDCARCTEQFWLELSTKTCKARTELNCKTFEPNADRCAVCAENFFKDTNDDNKCKPVGEIPNCEQYADNSNECEKCVSGYFLENNVCWTNPDGIEHCIKYSDLNVCSKCEEDFYLTNNKCEALTNPVENCEVHSSPTECEKCVDGYFLKSSVECKSNNLQNCDEQYNETTCKKCTSNYVMQRNQSGLECASSGIDNCLVAIGGVTNTCIKCRDNYIPSNNQERCVVPSGISNCKTYETEDTCHVCDINFIRSEDCSECIPRTSITEISNESLNTNCVSEVIKRDPVCSECKPGYRKGMHGNCLSCGGNGCALCGDDSRGDTCLVCTRGFYMDSNMKCQLKEGGQTVAK